MLEELDLKYDVLGLNFGVDPEDMALKLPLIGSIGLGSKEEKASDD
ncbi:MAG: hypothetical protein HOO00_06920 [Rhodospirillaceae bacterium]|nr:hypothetical protein [Rhodospirillaceae bacterium]